MTPNSDSVWIVSTEVRPLPGADAPTWCVGAYVECAVRCASLREALDLVEAQLVEEHYAVVDVSQALRYIEDDYDEDEPIHSLAAEADEAGGDVVYGPFEGWAAEGTPASPTGEA